jgi:hypothetical protein
MNKNMTKTTVKYFLSTTPALSIISWQYKVPEWFYAAARILTRMKVLLKPGGPRTKPLQIPLIFFTISFHDISSLCGLSTKSTSSSVHFCLGTVPSTHVQPHAGFWLRGIMKSPAGEGERLRLRKLTELELGRADSLELGASPNCCLLANRTSYPYVILRDI